MAVAEVRAEQGEIIGYADGEPIYADRAGDDEQLEARYEQAATEARLHRDKVLGYVYFIQAAHGGPVKIGFSSYPRERLRALQAASPHLVVVVGMVPGTQVTERELHRRFAAQRLGGGEWFELNSELAELSGARTDMGVPFSPPDQRVRKPKTDTEAMRERRLEREYVAMLRERRVYAKERQARGLARNDYPAP